jgi:hypothetical protein
VRGARGFLADAILDGGSEFTHQPCRRGFSPRSIGGTLRRNCLQSVGFRASTAQILRSHAGEARLAKYGAGERPWWLPAVDRLAAGTLLLQRPIDHEGVFTFDLDRDGR